MSHIETNTASDSETCLMCGSDAVSTTWVNHEFDYKSAEGMVVLSANVPVIECGTCGEQYFAQGAEEIRHEAVCEFLGRLTPKAIVELRKKLGMSQAQLAEHTGIGIASIKRWETGVLIQSAAMDKQLRALKATLPVIEVKQWVPVFRTEIRSSVRERAKSFSLRPQRCLEAA